MFKIFSIIIVAFSFSCKGQDYSKLRELMVSEQIEARGIKDKNVLKAMRKVERHKFVPADLVKYAYQDTPLPIGFEQTISQPYIVAFMTEIIKPNKNMKVLEIGTGSGYQAAILAEIVKEVYTIELVEPLYNRARSLLNDLGYKNIKFKLGDGHEGWEEYAPFDAIVVTAAAENVPPKLVDQLKEGGRMIIPVGSIYSDQYLVLIEKKNGKTEQQYLMPVRFVELKKTKK
ncbi:MAG: protein-L-isoaspartate(D-aspartate) O-methyltransferase [Bacteroidales bacterium]|nr:protein-L-isoaspartate(D-aspartate) O-methyltransferase [Bacteroidales bacterium]